MTRRGKYPATTPGTMAVNNAVRANAKIWVVLVTGAGDPVRPGRTLISCPAS